MEIVLCAVQSHLAAAWRERIGADLSNCVRVVETGYPPIPWCISAPTMRVPRSLETAEPAYLATRAAVRCALDAGLERVAIPGMGTGTGWLRAPARAWGRERDVSLPERPPLPWPGASAMLCIRQRSRRCWRRPVPSRRRYGS